MITHARWLMGSAALFNGSFVIALLFFNAQVGPLLDLAPASGTNLVMRDLALALVGAFGCAYLYAAISPVRGRPFIAFGAVGKTLAAVTVFAHWLAGNTGWQLPIILLGDVLYTALFIQFLRHHPAAYPRLRFNGLVTQYADRCERL
ncbi:MAG TPA: hypothetical protein VN798_01000 [Pseudomonas sp.]|nr:hypothetical protein [Pseudomonas sp.]